MVVSKTRKVLVLLAVAVAAFVYFGPQQKTDAAINKQINFQGKLVNTNGTNVANGTYNMEFKIVAGGNGCNPTSGTFPCSGSVVWTESRLVTGGNGVVVTDGIFQINLGSVTALPGSVDFNSDTIWLSLNLGNTNVSCTPFSSCAGDGEMKPLVRLTAAPYAMNSDTLDGVDSTAFGQLASNQTWTGTQTLQPTTNITSAIIRQTSVGSPTANIFNVQTANNTNIIQVTGPAANEAAVTIQSVGATRALTLQSGSGTISLGTTTNVTATGALAIASGSGALTLDSGNFRVEIATSDFLKTSVAGVANAAAGDIWYDTIAGKYKINENSVTKTLCNTTDAGCGTGGASRLDQITAATADASINNAANNIVWNWQLAAAEVGMLFAENVASTGGGTQNQFILGASTLAGSTASPLRVVSNSVDAADIVFNLNSAGDFEIQDAGTAVFTVNDTGTINILNNTIMAADLAVNGGDITSSGALNVTPGGAMVLGATTQAVTLQGSTATITSTGATNDITLNSADQVILTTVGGVAVKTGANTVATVDANGRLELIANGYAVSGISQPLINMHGAMTKTANLQSVYAVNFDSIITISADPGVFGGDILFRDASLRKMSNSLTDSGGVITFQSAPNVRADTGATVTVGPGLSNGGVTGLLTDAFLTGASSSSLTVTNMYGARLLASSVGNPTDPNVTVTNRYGLKVENAAGNGVVTNQYGIYLDNMTKGGTIDYGIYVGGGDTAALWVDSGATLLDGTLAVGDLITTSNKGVEFTESDTNPTCAAGNYNIFADLSETKLKKCVNGTVSDIDAGTKEEIITATGAGTWNKPADAVMVMVDAIGAGGGGGGGSSNTGAVVRTGGAGGGGGAYSTDIFSAADLGSSESYNIGVGGTLGTAGTSGNDGGAGGIGGNTTFGSSLLFAGGGGGGRLGDNAATAGAGGSGGGTGEAGLTGTAAAVRGGGPGLVTGGTVNTSAVGGMGMGSSITAAIAGAEWGGAAGGGHTAAPANFAGGTSVRGGGGGGVGGGATVTPAAINATAGGTTGTFSLTGGGGGAAGTTGAVPTAGIAGAVGNSTKAGTGGGGGGGTITASVTGGAGGDGGAPGGGAGGGGVGATANGGGAGGTGGRGELHIWTLRGSGADLAEMYCTNDNSLDAGDTIALDTSLRAGVKKTEKAYDTNTIGIIATSPGLVIGNTEDSCAKPVLVALAGRVPVKVSTENGPIKAGDLLTASSTPGIAMRATKAGQVIGQALRGYDGEEVGITVAFIKTNFAHGSTAGLMAEASGADFGKQMLAYLSNEAVPTDQTKQDLSEIFTDRVSAALEITAPKVTTDRLATNSIEVATGTDLTLQTASQGKIFIKDSAGKEIVNFGSDKVSVALDLSVAGGLAVNGPATFKSNVTFTKLVTFVEKTVFRHDVSFEGHLLTNGETPQATLETGAGTRDAPAVNSAAATASVKIEGSDTAGQINLKLGEGAVPGKVLAIGFKKPYAQPPKVFLTPASDVAASVKYYVESKQDGFTITLSDPPPLGMPLVYNYLVVQ